jgi:radical SAM superfamily enzyme YgiQ (UPF0313 family)
MKTKVLIIYPPNAGARPGAQGIYFPMGVGYIAGVLREHCDVEIHDLNKDFCLSEISHPDHTRSILKGYDYDIMMIGGVFPKYKFLKRFIEISHDVHPDAPIIVGGSYIEPNVDVLAPFLNADYYVIGEGEYVSLELVKALEAKRSVADIMGIAYMDGNTLVNTGRAPTIIKLDDLPFPARDLVDFNVYKRYFAQSQPLVYAAHMIGSRGCPFNCIFCNPAFGRKVNMRSKENILEEMELLWRDYGVSYFYIHDEMLLGGKKETLADFSEFLLKKTKGRFKWGGTLNHQLMDVDLVHLMARAGCVRIGFGVESGSNTILREMRKKHSLDKLLKIVGACNDANIEVGFSMLTNVFSETEETLHETHDYLSKHMSNYFRDIPQIHFITPIPGTDIYDEAKERGLVPKDDLQNLLNLDEESRYRLQYNLTSIPTEHLIDVVDDINDDLKRLYYQKHPLQLVKEKCGNLGHFRFRGSFDALHKKSAQALFEGILWAMSRGERSNLAGSIYHRMVYKD